MASKKSGFTLVELMTVIVIIGILTAIGMPAYSKYTTNAKLADGYVMMDTLKKLQLTYYAEKDFFFVAGLDYNYAMTEISSGNRILMADNGWAMQGISYDHNCAVVLDNFVGKFDLAYQPSNFVPRVLIGAQTPCGSVGNPVTGSVFPEIMLGSSGGKCTVNVSNGTATAATYGVEVAAEDWFTIALVGNFTTSEANCVMMVQTGYSNDQGITINPVLLLQ